MKYRNATMFGNGGGLQLYSNPNSFASFNPKASGKSRDFIVFHASNDIFTDSLIHVDISRIRRGGGSV
jgi:hypothetical protein